MYICQCWSWLWTGGGKGPFSCLCVMCVCILECHRWIYVSISHGCGQEVKVSPFPRSLFPHFPVFVVCMCVYMFACVWVWACMWRSKAGVRIILDGALLPWSLSRALFLTQSSLTWLPLGNISLYLGARNHSGLWQLLSRLWGLWGPTPVLMLT